MNTAVLDSAIATANALIGDDRATQSDVKAATEAISDAIAGLVEKSTTKPGQGGDKPVPAWTSPTKATIPTRTKGDADSGKHKKIPDTGAAGAWCWHPRRGTCCCGCNHPQAPQVRYLVVPLARPSITKPPRHEQRGLNFVITSIMCVMRLRWWGIQRQG